MDYTAIEDITLGADKSAPIIFEASITDTDEQGQPIIMENEATLTVRGWSTAQLISFGNFLLSDERKQYLFADADPKVVYDSDVENWKFLNKISTDELPNDEGVPDPAE